MAFVTGALAWWGPKFIHSGMILQPGNRDVTINEYVSKFGRILLSKYYFVIRVAALVLQTSQIQMHNPLTYQNTKLILENELLNIIKIVL